MADEWGPWIEHDGSGCPCPGSLAHVLLGVAVEVTPQGVFTYDPGRDPGQWHDCVFDVISEYEAICIAQPGGSWSWTDDCYPIVRYRLRRPAALRQLVDLVQDLPAPRVTEPA